MSEDFQLTNEETERVVSTMVASIGTVLATQVPKRRISIYTLVRVLAILNVYLLSIACKQATPKGKLNEATAELVTHLLRCIDKEDDK